MRFRFSIFAVLLLAPLVALAQPGRLALPDFSGLASKASQSVNISLDRSMLGLAAGVLSADPNPNDAAVRQLVSGLSGIYVHSFTFDRDGAYSMAAVDPLIAQLHASGWVPLVSAHDRRQHSNVEIYVHRQGNRAQGMAIIATQPRQLTVVNVVGSIDLAKLAQLQGRLGVPNLGLAHRNPPAATSAAAGPASAAATHPFAPPSATPQSAAP